MRLIDLKLTYECNNDCYYCCQNRNLRNINTTLTLESVKQIINKEIKYGIDKVVLTGGEPTVNNELIQISKYISEQGVSNIQLQTNGRKLRDVIFLQEVISSGVNSFGISLHGNNKKIHENFTGSNNSFEDLILGLEQIKRYDIPVSLNCVITKKNISNLRDIIIFVNKNKYAKSIQFAFVHITGKAKNGIADFVSISEAADAIKSAIEDIDYNITIMTEAIPLCLMYKHEKMVSELYNSDEIITYDFRERREFTSARKNIFKCKSPKCSTCLFNSSCEGTWIEYASFFGFDEFVPVKYFRKNYYDN